MNGYIKGARKGLNPKMSKAPRTSRRRIKGTSHHFFSCLRKRTNSLANCNMLVLIIAISMLLAINGRAVPHHFQGGKSGDKTSLPLPSQYGMLEERGELITRKANNMR